MRLALKQIETGAPDGPPWGFAKGAGTIKRPLFPLRSNRFFRRPNHQRIHSCFSGSVLSISFFKPAFRHCTRSPAQQFDLHFLPKEPIEEPG